MSEQTSRFRVEGMDCGGCVAKIDAALRHMPGIAEVQISLVAQTLLVTHREAANLPALVETVKNLGFQISRLSNPAKAAALSPWWQQPKVQRALASGLALLSAMGLGFVLPDFAFWGFFLALVIGLWPMARQAVRNTRAGAPFTIESLMTIAVLGALFIGSVEEGASVVFLFLLGELLEGLAAGRARTNLRGLTRLLPDRARRVRDGRIEEVEAVSLIPGDILEVRPGERIPADGLILKGESAIHEAPVTGESLPRLKTRGARVFAGTVNGDGQILLEVTRAATENTLARIVKLVEEAQETKAPTERLINRFSRYYTPAIVAVAALVALLPPLLLPGAAWSDWIYRGLALLLIGCPCALVLSTPAAIAAGLAVGARHGILLKGGAALETAGRITRIALDKTGTLTEGKPKVTDILSFGGETRETALSLTAALSRGSNHPLSLALSAEAARSRLPSAETATDLAALPGKGIRGIVEGVPVFLVSVAAAGEWTKVSPEIEAAIARLSQAGKSLSVLIRGGVPLGVIALCDELRPDAKLAITALRAAGVEALMLTGDNRAAAEAIAARLGIEVHAELLPEDKQNLIRDLQAKGECVAKVGDGINDAPALATAQLGIAMGGGADIALETADAALLHARLLDLAVMVQLSRRVMGNIRQNIALALGLKLLFLGTSIAGITGLWPAILADTGTTALVTANAMRLLRWNAPPPGS